MKTKNVMRFKTIVITNDNKLQSFTVIISDLELNAEVYFLTLGFISIKILLIRSTPNTQVQ